MTALRLLARLAPLGVIGVVGFLLGSTPPSEEQLGYSTALVHHQIEQVQAVLRPPDPRQAPA